VHVLDLGSDTLGRSLLLLISKLNKTSTQFPDTILTLFYALANCLPVANLSADSVIICHTNAGGFGDI